MEESMKNKIESPIDPQGQVLADCLHRLGEKPAEAYNTVQAVRSMSGNNVIHEIRTFGTSVDSKFAVQNAKMDVQNEKIDAQNAKIDALRWMIGVLIALLTLLAILGFFAFVGRAEPVADPCMHVAAPQASVQPEPSAAEPLVPTGESAGTLSDGRRDRSTNLEESRDRLRAEPQQEFLE